ncbi:MAG TPA: hypothetical protein VK190_02460 [Pseudoneobacillus sp.]|nr:hypothetical protein [Pseudoneobacillus sp.]
MATVEVSKSVPFYFVMDMKSMKYRKKDDEWVNSFHMAMRHQTPEAAEKVMQILTKKGNKNLRIVKHTLMLTVLEEEKELKQASGSGFVNGGFKRDYKKYEKKEGNNNGK